MTTAKRVGLASVVLARPLNTGEQYSEVSREHLLNKGDTYIVEFDILNHEGEDKVYHIEVNIDEKRYSESFTIKNERTITFTQNIPTEILTDGNVSFNIYMEGEQEPFARVRYYLD